MDYLLTPSPDAGRGRAAKGAKGVILNVALLESANVEKCESRFEVGGLGRGGISEAA